TEILFALGAGGQVVAVSDYCTGPPEALGRPRVGGFVNPNLERIAALAPDRILTVGEAARLVRFGRAQGIAVTRLTMETVADVTRAIRELGRITGREGRARELADRLAARLAAVGRRWGGGRPIPTLLVIARTPGRLAGLMTCSGKSFLSELLALAGGRNCFAAAPSRYLNPGLERVVAAAPEAILELAPDTRLWAGAAGGRPLTAERRRRLVADWQALPTLPAVRAGRIAVLGQPWLLVPSLHLPEIAEAMAKALHPEAGP
ncbi:MAG: hypothetical protein D6739_07100, partial [Nitrospirae bacterium]